MKARLISYSKLSDEIELDTDDPSMLDIVAFCARVSNPGNQANTKTSEKLVKYLVKHKHWSPLEMVNACIEIETTRDIARQMLRHRSFSFQEYSQRYADPTKDLSFVLREARLQDAKNRQNSIILDGDDASAQALRNEWMTRQQEVIDSARSAYAWATANGIAKEQARAVLPEGNTISRVCMNGTLRSWVHYIDLRAGEETQLEHREIAQVCADVIYQIFPMDILDLEKNDDING